MKLSKVWSVGNAQPERPKIHQCIGQKDAYHWQIHGACSFQFFLFLRSFRKKIVQTRTHSSRMRTGHSLTVCCSLLMGDGGGVCSGGGSGPGGVLSAPGGSSALEGLVWGCLLWGVSGLGGGCLLLGGVWSRGVSGLGGVSQHALRQSPLSPVDRHTLVKILPSLRPVIIEWRPNLWGC